MLVGTLIGRPPLDPVEVGLLGRGQVVVVGRSRDSHQVDARDRLGMGATEPRGDAGTQVAVVRDVARVTETAHQPVPELVSRQAPGGGAEREPGQGRPDDVVARGGEQVRQRNQLREGAGPAVGEHDREPGRGLGADVEEVHPLVADGGDPLRLLVEAALLGTPVEAVDPPRDQASQGRLVGAGRPRRLGPRPRPARRAEPSAQVVECRVGHGDGEVLGLHLHSSGPALDRRARTGPAYTASRTSATSSAPYATAVGSSPNLPTASPAARAGTLRAR